MRALAMRDVGDSPLVPVEQRAPYRVTGYVDPVMDALRAAFAADEHNGDRRLMLHNAERTRKDRSRSFELRMIQYGLPGYEFGSGEPAEAVNIAIATRRPVELCLAKGPVDALWTLHPPNRWVLTRAGGTETTIEFDFAGHMFLDECPYSVRSHHFRTLRDALHYAARRGKS
jgi:hypothetical protein